MTVGTKCGSNMSPPREVELRCSAAGSGEETSKTLATRTNRPSSSRRQSASTETLANAPRPQTYGRPRSLSRCMLLRNLRGAGAVSIPSRSRRSIPLQKHLQDTPRPRERDGSCSLSPWEYADRGHHGHPFGDMVDTLGSHQRMARPEVRVTASFSNQIRASPGRSASSTSRSRSYDKGTGQQPSPFCYRNLPYRLRHLHPSTPTTST